MTAKVSVQDLRIGMFIHLDLGWMSHPFPLSSFKISSEDQIETIRSLGLSELRWSPERSDLDVPGTVEDAAVAGAPTPEALPVPGAPVLDKERPQVHPAQARARALAAQQAALELCEKQYTEACRDLRRLQDTVLGEPTQARASAEQLTRALMDKMLVEGEVCVRLLAEPQGDRASSHSMNVGLIALLLARQLDLPRAQIEELGLGALLHDIGKLALPDRLRLNNDDFTSAEEHLYREHVAHGVVQGRRMGLSAEVLLIMAQHHEFADGTGWPQAVTQDRMSLGSRIVSMVNHYDNLCNATRPSQALTPHEALSRMFSQTRTHFDGLLLNGFIRMMGIYPPGSVVQLTDDRFAMVTSVNAARPLKPSVLVYDRQVPSREALHLNLELAPELGIRRSLRATQLPGSALEYLAPRQRMAYFFDVGAPTEELAA